MRARSAGNKAGSEEVLQRVVVVVVLNHAHVRLRETSPGVYRLDHDSGRHDDRAVSLALGVDYLQSRPVSAGGSSSVPRGQIAGIGLNYEETLYGKAHIGPSRDGRVWGYRR